MYEDQLKLYMQMERNESGNYSSSLQEYPTANQELLLVLSENFVSMFTLRYLGVYLAGISTVNHVFLVHNENTLIVLCVEDSAYQHL